MRVMFSGVSLHGHTLPLLPLARAFSRRRDDVVLAVAASFLPVFATEPFRKIAAGADATSVIAQVRRRTGVDLLTAPTAEAEIEAYAGARVDLSVADLLAVAAQWWPELIVHGPYDYAAPLVAAALDVPAVLVTAGPDVSPEFERAAAEKVAPRYRSRGLAPRAPARVLDLCPPALSSGAVEAPPGWLPLRPEPHGAPGGAPARPSTWPPGAPRVLVDFGTAFSRASVAAPAIRALAGTGASLRIAVGPGTERAGFGTLPGPAAFEEFAPPADLLDGADLVVAHGGTGTTLGTLAVGLPMVLVPQGADQFRLAERAVGAGAAVSLTAGSATPGGVVAAVADMAADPSYGRAARAVAAEIASMPSPDEVAAALVAATV